MTTNRPLRVFLCHSSNDKPAVRELYQKLRAEPWIQPWLDEEELFPGMDWDTEIQKAVEESDVVLVCLSNNSITKRGYIQKELRYVVDIAFEIPEEEIFIIPLRLEECTPPRSLREWHYADYFPEAQRNRAIQRLLVSLKKRAKSLDLKIIESNSLVIETPKPHSSLIKSIGVVYANITVWPLEKGTPLPSRKRTTITTTMELKKNEPKSEFRVTLIEGENNLADQYTIIGVVVISASNIKRNLPVGSQIEITLDVDKFHNLHSSAYIPYLDEEYSSIIKLDKPI